VVVSKIGYGIVADVIAERVPMLYTERGEFPEYPRLVQALDDCATVNFIPQADLLAGNLEPHLKRLLNRTPHWPAVELDGAEVAAKKILALM
jgi:predicted glycosyltransferase